MRDWRRGCLGWTPTGSNFAGFPLSSLDRWESLPPGRRVFDRDFRSNVVLLMDADTVIRRPLDSR